jgi:hypothetical protein
MQWHPWFRSGLSQPRPDRVYRPRAPGRGRLRPRLDPFEDRTLLASYTAASVSDLIADINAANKQGGSNTITLVAPTTSPYVLTAVDNTTDGPTGLPVIASKDNLTVVGNGDVIERSGASGTPAFRLFDVGKGGSLTLQNLTVQGGLEDGSGSSAEGGASFNQGTLILSGVIVQDNIAQGSDGASSTNGKPGNDAAGGGIWSNGSLTLQSGTLVQKNQAIGGNGGSGTSGAGVGGNGFGGALDVAGGTASLSGSSIDSNTAEGGEGGLLDPRVCGPNCTPLGEASAGHGYGGGLAITGGTVNLSGSAVDTNQAIGGALRYDLSQNGYAGNGYGGAFYVTGETVTSSGDTVSGNQAYGLGELALSGCQGALGFGSGFYVAGGSVSLRGDTVQSNSAHAYSLALSGLGEGGGLYVAAGATLSLVNDTVEDNSANGGNYGTGSGGACSSNPRVLLTWTHSPWRTSSTTRRPPATPISTGHTR